LGCSPCSVHALVLRNLKFAFVAEVCSTRPKPQAGFGRAVIARLVSHFPPTSYWLGVSNEMVAINTILIIVNGCGR
jgi:hypothetical protein